MTAQPAPQTTHAEPVMGTVFSFTAVHGAHHRLGVRGLRRRLCGHLTCSLSRAD